MDIQNSMSVMCEIESFLKISSNLILYSSSLLVGLVVDTAGDAELVLLDPRSFEMLVMRGVIRIGQVKMVKHIARVKLEQGKKEKESRRE